jgi:DNA-directed RNA polymerase
MSEIIRETFIALHSSDILRKLDQEVRIKIDLNFRALTPWLKQFRERYKGYKIPLDNLSGSHGSLIKRLSAAGVRIKAHRSQANVLRPLLPIIDFTDDEATTIVGETSDAAMEEGEAAAAAVTKTCKDQHIEGAERLLELLDEDAEQSLEPLDQDDDEEVPTRVAKAKAAAEAASLLAGKFVNLTDLIPPLPDKGSFEVESIKKSQYFFS